MLNKKKYFVGFLIVFVAFLIWYLVVKKSDYTITFKAKTATATVFQGIKDWSNQQLKSKNENYVVLEKNNFDFIAQKMIKGNQVFNYSWYLSSDNDSITEVKVDIKEEGNSIYNRLTAPFFKTKFKEEQLKKIKDFKEALEAHLQNFKVKINGEGSSQEEFVAYINMKSVLQEKAQMMIMNDAAISLYLTNNKIKIIGKPYVEIVKWDLDSEQIEFNYCFPIDRSTIYIADEKVKFKTIPAMKGLSATYYGNMRTSDRAWFALLDYAKEHNIKLNYKPLEHFFANPFNGGNEIEWETQIIIPYLKN